MNFLVQMLLLLPWEVELNLWKTRNSTDTRSFYMHLVFIIYILFIYLGYKNCLPIYQNCLRYWNRTLVNTWSFQKQINELIEALSLLKARFSKTSEQLQLEGGYLPYEKDYQL